MSQPDSLLDRASAAEAILAMASRRGLHASRPEVDTALGQVSASTAVGRLIATWEILFSGHSANRVPLALAHRAQLPAFVIRDGAVGIAVDLAERNDEAQIEWIGRAPADTSAPGELIVPVAPTVAPQQVGLGPEKGLPATQAIKTALKDHYPLFARVGVATVVMNLVSIATSLFAMQVYDRVIPNFAMATLWVLGSGVLLALVVEVLFKLVRIRLLEQSAVRLDEALSLYFFEKLLALKQDRRPARVGSLVAQFRDYDAIKNFFTSTTLFLIADFPFVLLFVLIIWMIGGPVALALIAFLVASLLIGWGTSRPIAKLQREETDQAARRLGLIFEAVSGSETVKACAAEPRFSDIWQQSNRAAGQVGSRLRTVTGYAQFALAFCQQAAYVGLVIVGVYVIQAGELTMGGLIACTILSGRALSTIGQITQLMLQWHHARHSLEVLNQILSGPSDEDETRQANTRSVPLGYEITGLGYAYEGSQHSQLDVPALKIEAGARIAIIGHNGSGKSTLLKLMAGIGTPSTGQIALAGLDLQLARPSWVRETIGYLPQDVRLFSGTLRENLTLGLAMPPEEAIHAAMVRTGLHRTLGRHPEGLDLMIKEGGSGLSGGQRQLVGLTRLVLQQPRVWLLDEPSASLDKEAEDAVIALLRSLPKDHTVAFTSHRASWLSLAQRVLLLENGRIKVDTPAEQVRQIQKKVEDRGSAAPAAQASIA